MCVYTEHMMICTNPQQVFKLLYLVYDIKSIFSTSVFLEGSENIIIGDNGDTWRLRMGLMDLLGLNFDLFEIIFPVCQM